MGTHGTGSDHRPPDKAEHGYRNEVSWDDGKGFQPYENQGDKEGHEPGPAHDHAQGTRGEHSGTNLEQLEQVKRRP